MYLLVWHFTKRTIPSLFSALAYIFSPFVLSFVLSSGVSERINLAWIPLFFLFVFRSLEHKTIKNTLFATLMLALASIGCWHYGLFIFQGMILFSIYLYISPFFSQKENRRTHYIQITKKLSLLAICCACVVIPISLLASESSGNTIEGLHATIDRNRTM